jgi:hypothetical protein
MRDLVLALVILIAAHPLRAAEVETATLAGRVVDSRMIVHRKVRTALFYLRLKVEVDRVESGRDLLRGAKTIEVRCWQENDGAGAYRGGHQPIPADGVAFSAVLMRHPEGFFEPVAEDAMVVADAATARTFPILTKAPSTTGMIVGGVVGLLVLVGAGVMRYRGRGPKDRSWSAAEEDSEG